MIGRGAVIAIVAAAVLGLLWVLSDGNRVVRDAPAIKTVLFLGNSFVSTNDGLHNHLRKLTQSVFPGSSGVFYFASMTKGGARLSDHVVRAGDMIANFRHKKKTGPWDMVVLQGQSQEPIGRNGSAGFKKAARQLDEKIRSSGSRTAFFMTWAYKRAPQMSRSLGNAYTGIGNELDALVAPVGMAFERARLSDPNMELYARDGKHPSLLGTYLAACVFFASFYGESPVGASYTAGLSGPEVIFAQSIAWNTVREYHGI